jgi:SAM-dependent methyltransferase
MNPLEYLFWRFTPPARRPAIGYFYFRHIKSLWYRGRKVACPCCGGRFRTFLPFQANRMRVVEGLLCPGCLSFPRHRLLWLYLQQRSDIFQSPQTVLHVAPEYFLQKMFRRIRPLRYVSTDLSSPFAMVRMDLTKAAFREGSFDSVICNHVLEHIPDDRRAMREIFRLLKAGGWAILQVPLDTGRKTTYEDGSISSPEDREKAFGQHDHVRIYGLDYVERLQESGFLVTVEAFGRTLDSGILQLYGLDREERIFLCRKPA